MQISFTDISRLQTDIMIFIDEQAHISNKPIHQKKIITAMSKRGIKYFTTILALNVLLTKGYIRRACITSNKTFYVQLKRPSVMGYL